jgi:DNA-binding SARP family transcriptional activator
MAKALPRQMSVALLGRFSLTAGGISLNLPITSRTEALTGYLAVHRERPVSRQELAENLWPDSEYEQARANLRKVLHQMRQHPWLSALVGEEGADLRWAPKGDVVLDMAEVEAAAFHQTTRMLEYARNLYQGPLLPHLDDTWIQPERQRLEQLHLSNLAILAERYLHLNAPAQALMVAQDLLHWDPFNEEHYRLCLKIHAARRDLASLCHTYNQAEELFRRELHQTPARETQQLFHALKTAMSSRDVQMPWTEPRPSGTLEASMATEAFLRWLQNPAVPSTFYLWAPPGGGKSTWLRQASRMAQDRGWLVIGDTPTTERVARAQPNGRRVLLVEDGKKRSESTAKHGFNISGTGPSPQLRRLIAGICPPKTTTQDLNKAEACCVETLAPLSPSEIVAQLERRGVPDPGLAQEIMAAAGGLPLAVMQAIDLWTESGVEQFSSYDPWIRANAALVVRFQKAADDIDPRMLAACSLLPHVEPTMLSRVLDRPVHDIYHRLAASGLFVATPDGLALRGEVRRLLLQNFQNQEPLGSTRMFREAVIGLLQEWEGRSPEERERIACECIFAIREFRRLNPEGYLFPASGLTIAVPTVEDQPAMFRLLKYWLQVEQAASSSRFSREWDNLMSYRGLRVRVVRDGQGEVLGFNVAVPVGQDSLHVLRHSRTTGVLAQSSGWIEDRHVDDREWVLRLVVYGPKWPATVQVLLETDLLGLFGTASALYVATPLTRYQRLLPALGFCRLTSTVRWNNGKLRPVHNYAIKLPEGFPGWIARYFREGFA